MTTIGDVVSALFTQYQQELHDEQLAALATQVALDSLLRNQEARMRRARQRGSRRGIPS